MYLYFDSKGVLREIVNIDNVRLGSTDYNTINVYVENSEKAPNCNVWGIIKRPDGTLTNEMLMSRASKPMAIPYDKNRDLKYFQDYKEYQFFTKTLSSEDINQNGLYSMTFRIMLGLGNYLNAQGMLTFNVQNNVIKKDHLITQSQYDYLIKLFNTELLEIKNAYIKSVNFEEGTYRLTFIKQDNSQFVVDLPIETMKTDIENLKANLGIEVDKLQAQIDDLITQVSGKQETLVSGKNIKELVTLDGLRISLLPTGEYDKTISIPNDIVEPYTILNSFNTHDNTKDVLIEIDDSDLLSLSLNPNIKDNLVLKDKLGKPNGVATLNQEGKVPTEQLPSYVDDVVEYDKKSQFPQTGEGGKIYVDKSTNKTYRWSGTTYVLISSSLALGETSGTAYEGSKGKANADAIANLRDTKQDKLTEKQINDINSIPNKLDKASGAGRVYTTDGMVGYTVGATNDTIVKRTSDGRIKARTPIEDDDVVTKSYLVGSEGIKTANDLLVLLETDDTGRMVVDLNETGNKVEIHLDNTFVDTLLTTSKLGEPNGVVPLDGNSIIPTKYLPGSVDEILEYDTFSAFPAIGEVSKIYVDKSTNLVYRWGGSSYVEISKSLVIGDVTNTAYDGGKGAQNAKDISALRTGKQDKLIAGANIEIQGTTISSKLTPATKNVIGGIKVGDGLKIDSTGLLSVNLATNEEVQAIFKGGIA